LPICAAEGGWRVAVPPATPPLALPGEPLIDWGGALRWYPDVGAEVAVREVVQGSQGTALRWRGPSTASRFHPLAAATAGLHRSLKAGLHPPGIFNRGRVVLGLWGGPAPPLQVDRATPELDDITAHQHLTLRVDAQAQRRRPARVLALGDLELAGERPPHRQAPAAEVRRRGAGGRIFQDGVSLREEEACEQRRTDWRKYVDLRLPVLPGELGEQLRTHPHPSHGLVVRNRH